MLTTCSHCANTYNSKPYKARQSKHYCSWSCKVAAMTCTASRPCAMCGELVVGKPSRLSRYNGRTFCSRKCQGIWRTCNANRPRFVTKISTMQRELHGTSCKLCGFAKYVEYAHMIPVSEGGTIRPSNIVALCPNHHKLYDLGLLDEIEVQKLLEFLDSRRTLPA